MIEVARALDILLYFSGMAHSLNFDIENDENYARFAARNMISRG